MTIGELAEQASVTPRTVRYYVEQGLLPAPEYGRPAEYTEEHLRRLDLIRRLKDQYLPLEEIRDVLQRLTLEEVQALADEPAPASMARKVGTEPLSSAADYLSQVLGRGAVREQLKQQTPAPPARGPAPPAPAAMPRPAGTPAAAAAPGSGVPAPVAPPSAATPARPAPPPAPAAPAREVDRDASLLPAAAGPPETWQRVTLAPGVELHYAANADPRRTNLVARLIAAARHMLESTPEKEREDSE